MIRATVIAAVAVAFSGAGGYLVGRHTGAADERSEWTERTAIAAAEASERARQIEQERFRATEILAQNHAAELARIRAADRGARTELQRLRDVLAERERVAAAAAAATGRPDDTVAERELFGACAAELRDMAAQADRIASRLTGLQRYVKEITECSDC